MPISADEVLELAASSAHSIVFGKIPHLAFESDGFFLSGCSYLADRHYTASVDVTRWLKGTGEPGRIRVRFPHCIEGGYDRLERCARDGTDIVLFLHRTRDRWNVQTDPAFSSSGIFEVESPAQVREVQRLTSIIETQTPACLARSADLIVVAAGWLQVPCEVRGRSWICTEMKVDSLVYGTHPEGKLVVSTRRISEMGPSILVLRRPPNGIFEPMGFKAGLLAIRDGRIDIPTQPTIRDFVRTLREATADR